MPAAILNLSPVMIEVCRRYYGAYSPLPLLPEFKEGSEAPDRLGFFKWESHKELDYYTYPKVGVRQAVYKDVWEKVPSALSKYPKKDDGEWLTLEGISSFVDGFTSGLAWDEMRDLWRRKYEIGSAKYLCAPFVYDAVTAAHAAVALELVRAPWQGEGETWALILRNIANVPSGVFTSSPGKSPVAYLWNNWPGMANGFSEYLSVPEGASTSIKEPLQYEAYREGAKKDGAARAEFLRRGADEWLGVMACDFGLSGVNFTTWDSAKKYLGADTFAALRWFWNLALVSKWTGSGSVSTFTDALRALRVWAAGVGVSDSLDYGDLAREAMFTSGGYMLGALAAARGSAAGLQVEGSGAEVYANAQAEKGSSGESEISNQISEAEDLALREKAMQDTWLNIIQSPYPVGGSYGGPFVSYQDLAKIAAVPWPSDLQAYAKNFDERNKLLDRLNKAAESIFGELGEKAPPANLWERVGDTWKYLGESAIDDSAAKKKLPAWLLWGGVALAAVWVLKRLRIL